MDQQQTDDLKKINPLAVMQNGEQLVCEIPRHPIGLLGIYLTSALLIVGALAGAVLVPYLMSDASPSIKLGAVLAGGLIAAGVLLYAYIAAVIYKGNRWVVTTDSVTLIAQTGLFTKHMSQLSMANLEDVSVEQNGLLPSLIGFGILRVESAGEHAKFVFPFCPDPNGYARKIIDAHERYIANRPEEMGTFNHALSTNQSFNQPTSEPAPDDNSQPR